MHSSQNEQDSRFYGDFAMIPILEPSNQTEAYDMAYHGFEISEKYNVPVLLYTDYLIFSLEIMIGMMTNGVGLDSNNLMETICFVRFRGIVTKLFPSMMVWRHSCLG